MTKGPLSPTALVICSTKGTCLPVMAASIKEYLPPELTIYISGGDPGLFEGLDVVSMENHGSNFGESYNAAIDRAFQDGHQYIWIANDDIVFHPTTWEVFNEDLEHLRSGLPGGKLGVIGSRADFVMWTQSIRNPGRQPKRDGLRWAAEHNIVEVPVVAPILAWISREAWEVAQFPPTNWYSDNVLCWDLTQAGYQHFASRAYVHHAGSQTIGEEIKALHQEALPWMMANRPEIIKELAS